MKSSTMAWLSVFILSLLACKTDPDTEVNPPTPTPKPEAKKATEPQVKPAVVSGKTGAVAVDLLTLTSGKVKIVPPIQLKQTMGNGDHAHLYGWSQAGNAFGYCAVHLGSGCTLCRFISTAGKGSKFGDCIGDVEPTRHGTRILQAKLKAMGLHGKKHKVYKATTWAHGGELELHWLDLSHAVHFGARLKGTKTGTYPIKLSAEHSDGSMHLETVAVSPDGKWIGIMGHGFCGEYTDTYPLKTMPVPKFAASVYNSLGMRYHQKKDYEGSAKLFEKAAFTDPKHKYATYNLACALALLKDPKAEIALRKAIALGGKKTKHKAKRDSDFDGVRKESWFISVVK